MSDDFTPNLTSDGSGGLWAPYAPFGTDPAKIRLTQYSMYHISFILHFVLAIFR